MEAHVQKENGLRPGRGFSLSEVEEAGFNVNQVRKLGVYVDPRRRTQHDFNVENLKTLIEERQKELEAEKEKLEIEKEKPKKPKEKKEKKKKEKPKKPKEKKEKEKPKKPKEKEEKEKPKKPKEPKEKPAKKEAKTLLTEVKGIGKKRADAFKAAGITYAEDLAEVDTTELAEKTKFSEDYIEKLKKRAENL
ncbi:MAG: ribosomal protein L13e [Candidatus Methanofastidiosia archaeon]|jgi:large subunit ribosomal protein L13e